MILFKDFLFSKRQLSTVLFFLFLGRGWGSHIKTNLLGYVIPKTGGYTLHIIRPEKLCNHCGHNCVNTFGIAF